MNNNLFTLKILGTMAAICIAILIYRDRNDSDDTGKRRRREAKKEGY